MLPKVSVIITNYNYARYISEAIESVLNQDHANLQLIVVDDGSTDNSEDVIQRYIAKLIYIKKANGGVSSARNEGMKFAEGAYIAFLDADDYWEKTLLSSQLSTLTQTGFQLGYCRVNFFNSESKSQLVSKESRSGDFRHIYLKNPGKTPFPPSSALISRNLAMKVGHWDPQFVRSAEDFDFFRRCSKLSKFAFTDSVLVNHREHSQSLTSGPLEIYFEDNQKATYKMLADSSYELGKTKKYWILIKFKILFLKSFLKKKMIIKAILVITRGWHFF
jgi:glycosyltransferase involved in cell wall biosynthesis